MTLARRRTIRKSRRDRSCTWDELWGRNDRRGCDEWYDQSFLDPIGETGLADECASASTGLLERAPHRTIDSIRRPGSVSLVAPRRISATARPRGQSHVRRQSRTRPTTLLRHEVERQQSVFLLVVPPAVERVRRCAQPAVRLHGT